MTLTHSPMLTPSRPPETASALPVRPAMSAWDSDVGMPKIQVTTPQVTMPTVDAARAIMAR